MIEFEPHDYFMGKSDEYTSRDVFKEHVRKTYDQIRELSDYIDQMIEELKQIGEEFEENELDRASAEVMRLASEENRVNAENVRSEFYKVFDGRLDDLESDKVSIKNLVTNGDFNQGATGWVFGQLSSDMVVSDGVSMVGARYVSYSPYYPIAIDKNKKYFISSQIKDNNLASSLMPAYALTNGNSPLNESQHLGSYFEEIDTEKFSRVSRVVTANNNYTSVALVKGTSNSSVSQYAYFDDLMFVNLTDTFGVGNEPTKFEMDELIKVIPNGWWDGELSLTQKQFITWQLNLIQKNTNAIISLGGTIV